MMTAALFVPSGSNQAGPPRHPRERFQEAFGRVALNQKNNDVLLIVEVTGTVQLPCLEHLMDLGEFGARLNIFDDAPLARIAEKALRAAFAGLSLALPDHVTDSMVPVGTIAFAIEPTTGRLLYNMGIKASGSVTSSIHLEEHAAERAGVIAQALQDSDELQDCVRLLSQSSEGHRDQLMAFLSAWTALELFVQRVFKSTYEPDLHCLFQTAAPASAGRFVERMREVMKDKYNIRDKFVAVASALDDAGAESDLTRFEQIKKRRDDLAHTMKGDLTELPVDATRDLLRKYLRLHLQRSPATGSETS